MTRITPSRWIAALSMGLMVATSLPLFSQDTAKGLIIHKAFPGIEDKLARATEFTAVEVFPQVVNFTPPGSNQNQRLIKSNVVEVVTYPDLTSGTYTTDQQFEALRQEGVRLGELARRFPAAVPLLRPVAETIQSALEMHRTGNVMVAGKWMPKANTDQPPSPGRMQQEPGVIAELTITREGGVNRTYTSVKVTEVLPDGIAIAHSAGVATIPYEQLPAQMQKELGFDPDKASDFRKQKAEAMAQAQTKTAASAAQNSEERPAMEQASGNRSDFEKMIENIAVGTNSHPFVFDDWRRMCEMLTQKAPESGRAALLKKGQLYSVTGADGAFSIAQRREGVVTGTDLDGKPVGLVICPQPELLDGVRLMADARWIGVYLSDQNTLPVFKAVLIIGPSPGQAQLISIRFPPASQQ